MDRSIFLRIGVVALFLHVVTPVVAEETAESETSSEARIDKTFSLRGGYWSSSRQLDDDRPQFPASVWGRMIYQPDSAVRFAFDGWIGNQAMAGFGAQGQVREAYGEVQTPMLDLRIGRQIIVWGRADALNPTDNLSPRRYTTLITEDAEQRIGIWAAKASMRVGELVLTGIYEPRFTATEIPLRRSPNVVFLSTDTYGKKAWALKLEREGGNVDWSISYYDGPDRSPSYAPVSIAPGSVVMQDFYRRIRVFGFDWVTTSGPFAFRGEAAYMQPRYEYENNAFAKKPFFYAVQGIERQFANSVSLIFQGFYKKVDHFVDVIGPANPALQPVIERSVLIMDQIDERKYGWMMRLGKLWANDTIETEILALMSYPRHDKVIRAKLIYRLTDEWKLTAGMDLFRGPDNSFYGQLKDNSAYYAMLEFHF